MTFVKVSILAMLLTLPIRAQDGAVQGAFTKYRIEDLPAAVQKTVQEHSGGRPIADIAREERNGQTVWEVEFDREGRNPRIQVANDGTLLAEKQPGVADQLTPHTVR